MEARGQTKNGRGENAPPTTAQLCQQKLLEMLSSDDTSVRDVARFLKGERLLSLQIMREAATKRESAIYPVLDLERAVQVLGFRRLRVIVARYVAGF